MHGASRGTVEDPGPQALDGGEGRSSRTLILALVATGALVAVVGPFADIRLDGHPNFVPAMLALVIGLDLIGLVLLLREFGESGDRRALVLGCAYAFSLAVLAGYGAAFPGVVSDVGPLGAWPSTAPWLWVAWHTGFPVLLALGVAPWPSGWDVATPVRRRKRVLTSALAGSLLLGSLVVLAAASGRGWLPVLIDGLDTTAMTRVAGPVILPLVSAATVIAVMGALRLSRPVRWAAVAAAVALADVLLTLYSFYRFSLGWYVGRTLTVVSCAVVLVAMLAEFGRLRHQLAVETERLRALLRRTEELEVQHATLLDHMPDGVMLQGHDGRVMAANAAARSLLGLRDVERPVGEASERWHGKVQRPDGTEWPIAETPPMLTLRTGMPHRDEMVGLRIPGSPFRWLRVNTSIGESRAQAGRYVVTSLTDETERYETHLASTRDRREKSERVSAVMRSGGPQMLVQPIVDLRCGKVVGGEALARFSQQPLQGPDRWFADAAEVGLGTALELTAVRAALGKLSAVPQAAYLSVNVSPATAVTDELHELLTDGAVAVDRIVLELTEHAEVADYQALDAALTRLRKLGVRVAVDDAGSGFASFRHILRLNPDIVKVDVDLVRDIDVDPTRRALVGGLVTFASQLGACLVAEGIETGQQLAALQAVGVAHGQGYGLGRPAHSVGAMVDSLPHP